MKPDFRPLDTALQTGLPAEPRVEAVIAAFERHMPGMLRYARHLGVGDDSEDVALDAFVRVWRTRIVEAGDDGPPGSYYWASVRNAVIDRDRARRPDTLPLQDGPWMTVPNFDDSVLERQLLHTALGALNARERQVLWWTVVMGHPLAEVATKLGMPSAGSVAVLSHRARRKLLHKYLELADPVDTGAE